MQIKLLGGIPKDSITGWKMKNNMHIHSSAVVCSQMNNIQVHPPWKLQVDWIPSGLTEGGGALGGGGQVSAPHNSTWARQGRAPQYTNSFCMAHWTQLHTWQIGQDCLHPNFFYWAQVSPDLEVLENTVNFYTWMLFISNLWTLYIVQWCSWQTSLYGFTCFLGWQLSQADKFNLQLRQCE